MKKIKIGITGQSGFVGSHLFNLLHSKPTEFEVIPFEDNYFSSNSALETFVEQCDTIIHLAAMNRGDEKELYNTNISLVRKLISALQAKNSKPHIIFSSSIQCQLDNPYGRSKLEGNKLFEIWAKDTHGNLSTLVIPNVFGAFGRPFYNSVIATFCYQLTHDQMPEIHKDAEMGLIYVNDLVEIIYDEIASPSRENINIINIKPTTFKKVSDILDQLIKFKDSYLLNNIIPELKSHFEISLFNTFCSYLEYNHFPVKLTLHTDERGYLFELIKSYSSGQTFYSVTKPGITRGNHYHTRKVERFCLVSGEAIIRLRKIGTKNIIEYKVSGNQPSFIDIPIFHTHNIQNIGESELLTIFWCNEIYNADDADTIYEVV